jgi:hypothetical protein
VAYAYSKDAASHLSNASGRQFTLFSDDVKPVPAISTPAQKQTLSINAFKSITGSATDNVGVTQVQLKLFRTREGVVEYWNGTSFSTEATLLPATLASPGSTRTNWTYTVSPALKEALQVGSYLVYAYAKDAQGNQSSAASRNFFLSTDDTKPVPVIDTPTPGQSLSSTAFSSITGSATDNANVSQVLLKLFRVRGGVTQFWNGNSFGTTSTTFLATLDAPNSTSTTWSYTVTPQLRAALDDGLYEVFAYGKDISGNQSAAVSRRFTITLDSSEPVTSPSDSASAAKSAGNS